LSIETGLETYFNKQTKWYIQLNITCLNSVHFFIEIRIKQLGKMLYNKARLWVW